MAQTTQTTAPAPPIVKPPQMDTRFRTTSLKELGKESEIAAPNTVMQTPDAKSDFSQDDAVKYWTEYAEQLAMENAHLKNTLINCKPILKDNFQLEVSVYNPTQKDEIFTESAKILAFLGRKLNNAHIALNINLAEKDKTDMIYTQAEKYNYLIKKNPALEKLKETFNLSLE